ncbi:unnamed protein product [Rhodiola kirilowii]
MPLWPPPPPQFHCCSCRLVWSSLASCTERLGAFSVKRLT